MKAFPRQPIYWEEQKSLDKQDGMDLRDYFAGQALTGLLTEHTGDYHDYALAELAYSLADEMMKARDNENN